MNKNFLKTRTLGILLIAGSLVGKASLASDLGGVLLECKTSLDKETYVTCEKMVPSLIGHGALVSHYLFGVENGPLFAISNSRIVPNAKLFNCKKVEVSNHCTINEEIF